MLVLSRQRDETIMIGDDIEITIVDIRGDKVRLGITAPNTIPVHRKEVYDAIQRENREAAKVQMEDLTDLPKTGPLPGKLPGGTPSPNSPGAIRSNRPPSVPVTRPIAPKNPQTPPPGSQPGNHNPGTPGSDA